MLTPPQYIYYYYYIYKNSAAFSPHFAQAELCQNIKTIKKTNPKTPSTPGVLEKPSRTGLHQTPPFR